MKIIKYHFYINLKTKNQLQSYIKKQQKLTLYIMNVVKEDMVVQVYVNMIQIQKNGL